MRIMASNSDNILNRIIFKLLTYILKHSFLSAFLYYMQKNLGKSQIYNDHVQKENTILLLSFQTRKEQPCKPSEPSPLLCPVHKRHIESRFDDTNTLWTCSMLISEKRFPKSGFTLKMPLSCQKAPIPNHFVGKYEFLLDETQRGCGESEAEKKPLALKHWGRLSWCSEQEPADLHSLWNVSTKSGDETKQDNFLKYNPMCTLLFIQSICQLF